MTRACMMKNFCSSEYEGRGARGRVSHASCSLSLRGDSEDFSVCAGLLLAVELSRVPLLNDEWLSWLLLLGRSGAVCKVKLSKPHNSRGPGSALRMGMLS